MSNKEMTAENCHLTQAEVKIISFGYKEGPPPLSNMVFDVRFLKNPYWVLELRALTGLDEEVKDFVLAQPLALEFLDSVLVLLGSILPRFEELEIKEFTLAFGCTGGQHRSTALAELLASKLTQMFPDHKICCEHRELKAKMGESLAVPKQYKNKESLEPTGLAGEASARERS